MKAIREAYGETLAKMGVQNNNIVVLDADVSGSTKSGIFGKEFPERFFNMGVSEANMIGTASGLASIGKVPFVNTFAVFMINRGADAIRNSICYPKLNVKFAGAYSGMSDSYDGATHHSIEDIAFMRALPNMTVFSVSDEVQTAKIVEESAKIDGPVYLRLSRAVMPKIYDENHEFRAGGSATLRDGNDITIIATGYMVHKALEAANELSKQNVSVRVIDMYSIKPIDENAIIKAARETEAIITLEEHNTMGGLGSAVSEVVTQNHPVPMKILGIRDTFTETGDYEALLKKYNLSSEAVIGAVKELIPEKCSSKIA